MLKKIKRFIHNAKVSCQSKHALYALIKELNVKLENTQAELAEARRKRICMFHRKEFWLSRAVIWKHKFLTKTKECKKCQE